MKTIKELEKEPASPVSFTKIKVLKDVLKLIDERIEHYSTIYGRKYQTEIQKAFIIELKELKARITG